MFSFKFQTRMSGSISLKLVSGANRLVPLRESKVMHVKGKSDLS